MNFKKLNEELNKVLALKEDVLNELRKEDAGEEITDFKDYDDALAKIKQKYDRGEILAYCPEAISIDYNDEEYLLAVVLGVAHRQKSGMKPHGMSHYLSKHSYSNEEQTHPTEDELIQAAKDIQNALKTAKEEKKILYDPFKHEIIFSNGSYTYIVCFAKDKKEINYLHSLFPSWDKTYLSRKKKLLMAKLKKEIPPKYPRQN